jgi:prepilin-type processing-associated H-X9-DG protein
LEVLVTLSIGLLTAAQISPAILKARETARQAQCQNHLKQIGLAMHNYNDTFSVLSPGFVLRDWNSATQQGFGWQSMILPFMDHAPTYNILRPDGDGLLAAAEDSARKEALTTRISVYRCPSDVTPDFNEFRGNWPTSNYSGNAGHRPFPRLITGAATDFWPGQLPTPVANRSSDNTSQLSGLFSVNSSIRMHDITDGTSHTIMIGERGVSSLAGIWCGVTSATHENDALTETSHLSRPNSGWTSFSSPHSSSFNILMADGAVKRIDDSIDSQPNTDPLQPLGIYQRLGSRNDGQILEF